MDGIPRPIYPTWMAVKGRSDVLYLYAARAARGFGDGFAAIVLPAYLIEIGFNPFEIGVVAAAALLGSAALTLAIGFLAPRHDLRRLLLACALLMIASYTASSGGLLPAFLACSRTSHSNVGPSLSPYFS